MQTQKATYYTIPLIWHSGKGKIIETEVRLVTAKGWGWQTAPMTEGRGDVRGENSVPYLDGVGSYMTGCICQNLVNCTVKKAKFYCM